MKKIYIFILIILSNYLLSSEEVIKFKDIKSAMNNVIEKEIKQFIETNKNKKLERETGWVFSVKGFDSTTDIVCVEMDKPNKDFKLNKPDLYFIIDKKISRRLSEYQLLYFNGSIKKYDIATGLFEITDVFLSGLMR